MKKIIVLLMACLSSGMSLANHWTPQGANYSGVMSVYSVIQIDGIEQYSDQLEVGAFCGDECRGSAIAGEFYLTHRYLAILTIYGETGHQLTFKLYDHNTGQEYELASQETITFVEDGYGNPINPYVLNFTEEQSETTQTITLSQGWNWFSTYLDITLDDLKAALVETLPGTAITIKSQTQNTTYNPNTQRWGGNLTWDVAKMYNIKVAASCEITLVGTPINPAEHPVTIVNGVNWIGFPFSENMSISDVFAGFAANGDKVKSQNSTGQYQGGSWRGNLNALEPGKGYVYISNTQGIRIFIFPINTK